MRSHAHYYLHHVPGLELELECWWVVSVRDGSISLFPNRYDIDIFELNISAIAIYRRYFLFLAHVSPIFTFRRLLKDYANKSYGQHVLIYLFCVLLVTFILVSVYSCLRNTAGKYTETSSTRQNYRGSFFGVFCGWTTHHTAKVSEEVNMEVAC